MPASWPSGRAGTRFLSGETHSGIGASPKRISSEPRSNGNDTWCSAVSANAWPGNRPARSFFSRLRPSGVADDALCDWSRCRFLVVHSRLRLLALSSRLLLAASLLHGFFLDRYVVVVDTYTSPTRRYARNEIRETMVSAPTVLDLRSLRSLEVNPLWGIVLTAPADPSTRKQFPSNSLGRS